MNLRIIVPSVAVRGIVVVMVTTVKAVTPTFFKFARFSFDGYFAIRCDDFALIGTFHLGGSLLGFRSWCRWSLGRYRSAIAVVHPRDEPKDLKKINNYIGN
jgi:hypothetical protein